MFTFEKGQKKTFDARLKSTESNLGALKAELERERSLGNCLRKIDRLQKASKSTTYREDHKEVKNSFTITQPMQSVISNNALDIIVEMFTKNQRKKWDRAETTKTKLTFGKRYLCTLTDAEKNKVLNAKREHAEKIVKNLESAGIDADPNDIRKKINAETTTETLERIFSPVEVFNILRKIDAAFYTFRKETSIKPSLRNIKIALGMSINDRDVKQHKNMKKAS